MSSGDHHRPLPPSAWPAVMETRRVLATCNPTWPTPATTSSTRCLATEVREKLCLDEAMMYSLHLILPSEKAMLSLASWLSVQMVA